MKGGHENYTFCQQMTLHLPGALKCVTKVFIQTVSQLRSRWCPVWYYRCNSFNVFWQGPESKELSCHYPAFGLPRLFVCDVSQYETTVVFSFQQRPTLADENLFSLCTCGVME